MPKAYESMRDKFAKGAPKDSPEYNAAQSKAAAIYNSKHKSRPVTGKSDTTATKAKAVGGKKKSKKRKKRNRIGGIAEDVFGKY